MILVSPIHIITNEMGKMPVQSWIADQRCDDWEMHSAPDSDASQINADRVYPENQMVQDSPDARWRQADKMNQWSDQGGVYTRCQMGPAIWNFVFG